MSKTKSGNKSVKKIAFPARYAICITQEQGDAIEAEAEAEGVNIQTIFRAIVAQGMPAVLTANRNRREALKKAQGAIS